MLIGSLVRLSYGLGALLAPEAMSRRRLAPDIRGHAGGRMDLRGFGALQVSVALATLFAAVRPAHARPVLALNLSCETLDGASGLLEWRARGGADRVVTRSLLLSATGVITWLLALRAIGND